MQGPPPCLAQRTIFSIHVTEDLARIWDPEGVCVEKRLCLALVEGARKTEQSKQSYWNERATLHHTATHELAVHRMSKQAATFHRNHFIGLAAFLDWCTLPVTFSSPNELPPKGISRRKSIYTF